MILIGRKYLYLFFLLVIVSFLVSGFHGYSTAVSEEMMTQEEEVIYGETLFFISIVTSLVATIAFLALLGRSSNILRELDKIIEISYFSNYSPRENFRKMGGLGKRLDTLYAHINEMSEKKSLKISSLSGIIDFLLLNVHLPLVILDITGRVTEVSRRYVELFPNDPKDIISLSVERLVPELEFPGVLAEMKHTHTSVEGDYGNRHLTFTPILNRDNDISNIICVFGRDRLYKGPAVRESVTRPVKKNPGSLLRDFFGPAGKKT